MSPPGSAPSCSGTRRTGPTRGSADSSLRTLGTPFFPLVQSGLEGFSADLMDEVPDLEFSPAKKLSIGLGGEQLGDRTNVVADGLHQDALDALRLDLLLGCEWAAGHGVPPCVQLRRETGRRISTRFSTRFPTHFRDAYPSSIARRQMIAWGGRGPYHEWPAATSPARTCDEMHDARDNRASRTSPGGIRGR